MKNFRLLTMWPPEKIKSFLDECSINEINDGIKDLKQMNRKKKKFGMFGPLIKMTITQIENYLKTRK